MKGFSMVQPGAAPRGGVVALCAFGAGGGAVGLAAMVEQTTAGICRRRVFSLGALVASGEGVGRANSGVDRKSICPFCRVVTLAAA